ncbi:hypothetical protein [Paenibacillus prosopidis]|nr:hypothetical protein [Paenibacillus prosopidis]
MKEQFYFQNSLKGMLYLTKINQTILYRIWRIASLVIFLFGIVFWSIFFFVPGQNKPLNEGMPIWLWTLVANPIGAVFGYFGKSRLGLIGNIVMAFSIFPMIFIASVHEYILHVFFGKGKP